MNCPICQRSPFLPAVRGGWVAKSQILDACGANAAAAVGSTSDSCSCMSLEEAMTADGWVRTLLPLLMQQGRVLALTNGCDTSGLDRQLADTGLPAAAGWDVRAMSVDDLLSSAVAATQSEHTGGLFDAVLAVSGMPDAVDLPRFFVHALAGLHADGLMLFEVALAQEGSARSEAEGRKALTECALRTVIEEECKCILVSATLQHRTTGRLLVGLVLRHLDAPNDTRKETFTRVADGGPGFESAAERLASVQLRLFHVGLTDRPTLRALAQCPEEQLTRPWLQTLVQIWALDQQRSEEGVRREQALIGELHRLRSRWEKPGLESVETRRLEAAACQIDALQAEKDELTQQLQAVVNSRSWRLTGSIRNMSLRHPALAARAVQVAKLVKWTADGSLPRRLFARLRGRRAQRVARQQEALSLPEPSATGELSQEPVVLLAETGMDPSIVEAARAAVPATDAPLVSVVIPCFNYGHLVGEAIDSVLSQTWADLEVLVVEGGSSSPTSLELFAEAVAKRASSRLRVVRQTKPYRAGANRNTGIAVARGQYICCLDADDRLEPTYIEKAVFLIEQGYDVVSTELRFFGDRTDVYAPHTHPTLDLLLQGNQVLTCALFRKTLWTDAGGFRDSDPATGHLHEDWLFWVRLAALGARFINIPEPLLSYRSHGETLSNSKSVLSLATQMREVRRLNADVLTPEALLRARALRGPAARAARGYRTPRRIIERSPGPTLLLAMPYLILGGAERLLSSIIAHLTQRGWRVVVLTTLAVDAVHGDTTEWFEASTHEIFHLPRFLDAASWRDFLDYLLSTRSVDLAWVVGSAFFYEYLPALRLRHPQMRIADLLFNTIGHVRDNRCYADCIDRIFVESAEVQQWLMEAGEAEARISLVSSGVDLEQNFPASDRVALRRELDLPVEPLLVGFFGRWSEEKDPLAFVEVARTVPADCPVTFVMTGAGPLAQQVQEMVKAARFASTRFVLKGTVADVKPYIRACDIVLLPSRHDGRPNVVMEALASGTVVLASRVGALPEMVQEGRNGHLSEPGDVQAFVRHITALQTDRARLALMQRHAREWAEQMFDMKSMLDVYEQQLTTLVREPLVGMPVPSC